MARIDDFISKFPHGGARPYLFQFRIDSAPAGVAVPTGTNLEDFRYLTKTAEIPEATISSIEIPYQGRKLKIPGSRTFADLSVTVLNDENFALRNFLESWIATMAGQREVFGQQASLDGTVGNPIATSIYLDQFSKQGVSGTASNPTVLRTYEFVLAFPTSVSTISLDWDQADAIQEYTVTFAYQYWTVAGADGDIGVSPASNLTYSQNN